MKIKLKQMCRLINIQKTHLKVVFGSSKTKTFNNALSLSTTFVFKTQEIKSNKKKYQLKFLISCKIIKDFPLTVYCLFHHLH